MEDVDMKKARTQTATSSAELSLNWRNDISNTRVLDKLPADNAPYLATHNGHFHCDEALALAMLKILPEFKQTPIVRTRDPEIIKGSQLVVDVGGLYEPDNFRFDHHMATFTTTFGEKWKITKLSSAGLVYKHFGEKILREIGDCCNETPAQEDMNTIITKLYSCLIQEVDAVDNGVEPCKNSNDVNYRISSGLAARVGRCNPSWREEGVTSERENDCFKQAMLKCQEELFEQTRSIIENWYPARKIVEQSLAKAENQVMVLPRSCPWQDHLLDIELQEKNLKVENEEDFKKLVLYVVYPDSRSGSWRIQAVPKTRGSFLNRKPLPEAWRGVRDEELSEKAGIKGCVFCHASGFIGGNQTFEGVMEMANKAVAL